MVTPWNGWFVIIVASGFAGVMILTTAYIWLGRLWNLLAPGLRRMAGSLMLLDPDQQVCGHCGYDARSRSGVRCPECGADLRIVGFSSPLAPLGAWLLASAIWTLVLLLLAPPMYDQATSRIAPVQLNAVVVQYFIGPRSGAFDHLLIAHRQQDDVRGMRAAEALPIKPALDHIVLMHHGDRVSALLRDADATSPRWRRGVARPAQTGGRRSTLEPTDQRPIEGELDLTALAGWFAAEGLDVHDPQVRRELEAIASSLPQGVLRQGPGPIPPRTGIASSHAPVTAFETSNRTGRARATVEDWWRPTLLTVCLTIWLGGVMLLGRLFTRSSRPAPQPRPGRRLRRRPAGVRTARL